MEKKVLGKGLSALIPDTSVIEKKEKQGSEISQKVINIPVDKVKGNRYQPRDNFDEESIRELAVSIKEKGLIQPIVVKMHQGEYELISGERRLKAVKSLKLENIPAIVRDASDLDSLELSIIENVQREDLNGIDQAKAYRRLLDEFNMTQEAIADRVGKDRVTITNIIRLLKLPKKIQELVSHGTISMGHAKAILYLHDEAEQFRLCTKIIKNNLTVRESEYHAKELIQGPKSSFRKTIEKDANLIDVEQKLREIFGTKVKILKSKKGGKIEIEFYSDKDLERVVAILNQRGNPDK